MGEGGFGAESDNEFEKNMGKLLIFCCKSDIILTNRKFSAENSLEIRGARKCGWKGIMRIKIGGVLCEY